MTRIPIRIASRSKYHAKRTNGYASGREAKRAFELSILQRAGEISDLREQVPYELIPAHDGLPAVRYFADFVYQDKTGKEIVEDAKGVRTPLFRLKSRLMLWRHKIRISEV